MFHHRIILGFTQCHTCGKRFRKDSPNQKYCQPCRAEMPDYLAGCVMKYLLKAEPKLKAAADASGNPKIYRAGEYSQEFLKGLITR